MYDVLLSAWPAKCTEVSRRRQGLLFCLLWASWWVGSWSSLKWMFSTLSHPEHVVQLVVLLCLGALGLFLFFSGGQPRQSHPQALLIILLGVAFSAIIRFVTDVRFIHAIGAAVLFYALCAMVMSAQLWRKRLVLLLLVLLCLPIQPHVDAHLGLPLRLWTAQVVAPLLNYLGVANVTVESVIVTENSVADIASVCSGVRTLWFALALWLCGRLVWPQTTGWRWALAGVLTVVVAVGFNSLRVAVLVLALHHDAPLLLADMAHASFGLLALAAVGAINLLLCRQGSVEGAVSAAARPLSWPVQVVLGCLMLGLAVLPSPSRSPLDTERLQPLVWPAEFALSPLPFSPVEQDLVLGHHAIVAEKFNFERQGVHGSLMVVASDDWRAQHAPELCLLAQGAHIENVQRVATPDGAFRVVALQAGAQTAITWFQAGQRVSPDIAARLWSQLFNPREQWALVTLVLDGPVSSDSVLALYQATHAVVATSMQESS